MTKIHKLEIVVVDHDDIGAERVKEVLEIQKYPNWCMSPTVLKTETKEVEWSDDHPLNYKATMNDAAIKLFEGKDNVKEKRNQ